MKFKPAYLYVASALIIILFEVFAYFPIMGHDYSMYIPGVNDFHHAWNNFSVIHIDFSPQRCLGIPVWANPTATSYSIFHVLSLFLDDLSGLVIYITLIVCLSFWGVLKLQNLLNTNKSLRNYFAFAWCLQGYLVTRIIVGHVPFISIGLWPLYTYVLLKQSTTKKSLLISTLAFTFLFTTEFYSGNTYLFVMFPIAFSLFILLIRFNDLILDYKTVFKKLILGLILTVPLILPKVLAIVSYTSNFIRGYSFNDIGFLKGFEYSVLSILFPLPLDYRQMTGWNYGNWEAMNFLFPGLLLFILAASLLRLKSEKKVLISIIGVVLTGAFIASGVYSNLVLLLPVVKSFHVNPRWMPIINLPILGMALIYCSRNIIPLWSKYLFIVLAVLPTIYSLDKEDLEINYLYHYGYNKTDNKIAYCYEPTFGYKLELMPKVVVPPGRYYDPRCYLGNANCTDYILPEDLEDDLETYKLRPFKN